MPSKTSYTKMTRQQGLKQHKQKTLLKSVKQQIIYFSQLHISAILLYKNLHNNMLHIFIPIIFLRKYHLLIDNQKDPTPNKFTASLLFFLARAYQYKISKIGIIILSLFQLKLHILQNCKHSKSTYPAIFYSPIKILETVCLIFL